MSTLASIHGFAKTETATGSVNAKIFIAPVPLSEVYAKRAVDVSNRRFAEMSESTMAEYRASFQM